jgi:hypothetical protein
MPAAGLLLDGGSDWLSGDPSAKRCYTVAGQLVEHHRATRKGKQDRLACSMHLRSLAMRPLDIGGGETKPIGALPGRGRELPTGRVRTLARGEQPPLPRWTQRPQPIRHRRAPAARSFCGSDGIARAMPGEVAFRSVRLPRWETRRRCGGRSVLCPGGSVPIAEIAALARVRVPSSRGQLSRHPVMLSGGMDAGGRH